MLRCLGLIDADVYGLTEIQNDADVAIDAVGLEASGSRFHRALGAARLQAGAATALFIAGFGAAGYATRRDLSALAHILFWALIGLIVFGIVTIFVQIPNGALIYAVGGLVIFAGLTAFDFQRLRRNQDIRTAPLLAASIFLDILNVFLLLLSLFSGSRD